MEPPPFAMSHFAAEAWPHFAGQRLSRGQERKKNLVSLKNELTALGHPGGWVQATAGWGLGDSAVARGLAALERDGMHAATDHGEAWPTTRGAAVWAADGCAGPGWELRRSGWRQQLHAVRCVLCGLRLQGGRCGWHRRRQSALRPDAPATSSLAGQGPRTAAPCETPRDRRRWRLVCPAMSTASMPSICICMCVWRLNGTVRTTRMHARSQTHDTYSHSAIRQGTV